MNPPSDARTLGEFLRARRADLDPHECGLPQTGSRRVAGLRREEVALLAAISVDYYTRLEQGRVRASAAVLDTLSRALRLDEDQQSYLYEVAGRTDDLPRRTRRPAQQVRPAMRRLLAQLPETPALVLGRRLDVLAWNRPAVALYTDFGAIPPERRNYLRLMFTDPVVRDLHREWEHDARDAVAALRMEAGADPDDPELARLVGDLTLRDTDFSTWWAEHRVNSATYGTKHYRHPLVGDLTLDCDTWSRADDSGQRLMVLTAETGSPSHDALRILTAWTADRADAEPTATRTP
ncbi:helix-turn-helix domain-containing protein [Streptomyces kunmingensis]|uniref:Helix-turn-helix domain-containing protein n=1 Tax=Streptomyces kunmingensis TaxID=68225 RepID=A0ABU6CCB7_9ACTN|nr:helix-turn-helix domain-containing protein [Streptomyces kunmingensis]MEB3962351.1 helix-turn-helix domain-containing protein [Streptomyces kunmingensis]